MINRGPDFIGLGSGRSGSNWLSACLFEHPDVCLPAGEVNFFNRERNWRRGLGWYENLFAGCPANKKKGELTALYFSDFLAPERIHRHYPDVKLIVSLRNPVERAFSNYVNELSVGLVAKNLSFLEAAKVRPDYINAGRHFTNLRRWLKYFPRERLLVIIYDDIVSDPAAVLRKVYQFIGVNSHFTPPSIGKRVNRALYPRFVRLNWLFAKLSGILNRPPLKSFWWLIKKTGLTDLALKLNAAPPQKKPVLTEKEKAELYKTFREEILPLEKFLDRKLTSWHY